MKVAHIAAPQNRNLSPKRASTWYMEDLRSLTGTVRSGIYSKTWSDYQRYNRLKNRTAIAEERLGVASADRRNQTHGEKSVRGIGCQRGLIRHIFTIYPNRDEVKWVDFTIGSDYPFNTISSSLFDHRRQGNNTSIIRLRTSIFLVAGRCPYLSIISIRIPLYLIKFCPK